MTPKTVVLETRYAGHTVGFAREMAEAFATAGHDTTFVLNGSAKDRPELRESGLEDASFGLRWTEPFEPAFAAPEQGRRELALLSELAAEFRPDRLVVPTGDAIAAVLPRSAEARALESGLPRMDVVLHHVAAAYPPRGVGTWRRWRRGLSELAALRRHRLLTCDAYIGLGPGRWSTALSGARFDYLPHVLRKTSDRNRVESRAHFGVPADRKVLVSIGDVAHRKGIDRLIAAAADPAWPGDLVLLLAGPVSEKLRPELERVRAALPERICLIDRFLSDAEFAAAFVAADIIWAVTPSNLGVSSTFLYAALHGKPAVLAENHRSARWMRGRIGPGVLTTLDPAAICRAVASACDLPPQSPDQRAFLREITDTEAYDRIVVA